MASVAQLPGARSRALRAALTRFAQNDEPMELVYTARPDWDRSAGERHIAVLDASFNPPTRAHLALASMPRSVATPSTYDAHLFLFSVRNADKGRGKAGDASPLQRLEMIELLAKQLENDLDTKNVAVALVDEPLVFNKSTLLHTALHKASAPLYLHWLLGSDTVTRVFQPKYYPSEEHLAASCEQFFRKEQTRMVCARRSADPEQQRTNEPDELDTMLQQNALAKEWYARGCLDIRTLPPAVERLSSTAVRAFLQGTQANDRNALASMVPDSLVDYLLTRAVYTSRQDEEP